MKLPWLGQSKRRQQRQAEGEVPLDELRQRQLVIGLGAMKCGTTWLAHYLASHPEFFHSPIKEMHALNLIFPNPDTKDFHRKDYRLLQMERLILSLGKPPWDHDITLRHAKFDRLRALAQLSSLDSIESYLSYFSERISHERHFGESTPFYSLLTADALSQIALIAADVRFLFVMRDPTSRAVSHLRHLRRRQRADADIDTLISEIEPGNAVFVHSDYSSVIRKLRSAGVERKTYFLVAEQLFSQASMDGLCDWLGMKHHPADLGKRLNPGVGEELSLGQWQEVRRRLEPIYETLRSEPLLDSMDAWAWQR
jgi:hypothetical protein